MGMTGIETIAEVLKQTIYSLMLEYDAIPKNSEECSTASTIIGQMSIGQLWATSRLGDRMRGFKLVSRDNTGTVYVNIADCYGGMELDGSIHT